MEKNKTHKMRMKLLIYPKFQLLLIFVNTLLFLFMFAVVTYQVNRSFDHLRELSIDQGMPLGHPYFKMMEFQSHLIFNNLIIAFSLALILSLAATLFLSHRLAGPIVRLLGYFQRLGRGDKEIHPLSFRKGDFFYELASVINDALKRLTHKK